ISLDKDFVVEAKDASDRCGMGPNTTCFRWGPLAPTNFPPMISTVGRSSSTINILQARLSSDPVRENAEAIITLHQNMRMQMQIIDILGNVRQSNERMLSAGENRLPVNASALAAGVYIFRLQAGGEVVSLRFVKE
ncbi:MAG: T9SS type A sorting domain-containing protein, partial [Ignavibacteriota bacterium]